MLIARGASRFIRRFGGPGDDSGIFCFKFWQLVPAGGCPYRCSYCFLQTTPWFRFNPDQLPGFAYTNVDHMPRELDAWLQDPVPKRMTFGELQDGLAFETAFKKATAKLARSIVPALCKEDQALWREIGMPFQGCHSLLWPADHTTLGADSGSA